MASACYLNANQSSGCGRRRGNLEMKKTKLISAQPELWLCELVTREKSVYQEESETVRPERKLDPRFSRILRTKPVNIGFSEFSA